MFCSCKYCLLALFVEHGYKLQNIQFGNFSDVKYGNLSPHCNETKALYDVFQLVFKTICMFIHICLSSVTNHFYRYLAKW